MGARVSAAALLLLVLIAAPGAAATMDREEPVHVEPQKGSGYIDAISLYSIYLSIFIDIINGNYTRAVEKIDAFDTRIFPGPLREKLDAMNADLRVLAESLGYATLYVNMSDEEIRRGNYTGARRLIDEASFYTTKSSVYLGVVRDDWISLSRTVLAYTNPDYYDKVRSYELEVKLIVDRIMENIYVLQGKTISLLTMVYEHTRPGGLFLSLRAMKPVIKASEPIRLRGRIYFRNGTPLINASVFIYLLVPNTSLIYRYEIRSGRLGLFDVSLMVPPFFYQGSSLNRLYNETFYAVAVSSIYVGERKYVALGRVEFNVLYRVNRLVVRGPNVQNPDLNFTYTIYYVPRNASRRLVVKCDDTVLYETVLNSSPAKITIHTPWNATPGYHRLLFHLDGYEEYIPVTQTMNVIVAYKPYEARISVTQYVVYPFQKIVVEGRLSDLEGRPLVNETITVMDHYVCRTDKDGLFRVEIEVPFTTLVGIVAVKIHVGTRENYYADLTMYERVAVVNSITLVFIAVYILLVLRYTAGRRPG